MKQRPRIYYTETDKALMWDRWQKGESLNSIARHFDRHHSAIQGVLARTGGIRPPKRKRSRLALTLGEREDISRSLVAGHSVRSMAASLGRSPSTVSREINRNGGGDDTARTVRIKPPGIGRSAPRAVNWCRIVLQRAS